jgi:transposase
MKYTTNIGFDVHDGTIAVATIHRDAPEAEFLGTIPNNPDAIRKLIKKLGDPKNLKFCYEAGPCGYVIYRQLTKMGISCLVAAPSLIPTKPGERIKTDKRDAKKLAKLLRNGDLTPVWVPDDKQEALRDLLRAREAAGEDLSRKRKQLSSFLMRLGIRPPGKMKRWTVSYCQWLKTIKFEEISRQIVITEYIYAVEQVQEKLKRYDKAIAETATQITNQKLFKALQALKGVGLLTAATLIAEIGDISRFKTAPQLMCFLGLIPGEHSSGDTRRQGGITKTGNTHVRYLIVESSHHYRLNPRIGPELKKRQEGVSEEVKAIAWKAQHRLHHKYRKMVMRGKSKQKTVVAISRELTGFIWAIASQVAKESVVA